MHRWILGGALCAATAISAQGAATTTGGGDPVALSAQVFIEHRIADANGAERRILAPVQRATSGDRLVFVLRYRNVSDRPVNNYVVANALPRGVRIDGARDIEISADGGAHWGRPGALFATGADGRLHPIGMDAATHVRWVATAPIAAGASGQISYRGTVR